MRIIHRSIFLFSFLFILQLPVLFAQFDSGKWYRLTTKWQGECRSLDLVNNGHSNQPILNKTGDHSGQYWKITPAGGGYFRLSCKWQGDGKSLDILNDGQNNRLILANTGDYSGQKWRIEKISGEPYYRLNTEWQGKEKSLDIVNDGKKNQPVLANTGNYIGQKWNITEETFISTPPAALHLNSFYQKYLDADGVPIVSSEKVSDEALMQVKFMSRKMLALLPEARREMIKRKAKIAVMAQSEVTTDIPEHAFLKNDPTENWDTRARGLGGTPDVPTSSCAEENILCYEKDGYWPEDIFIHEFAHSIHLLGLNFAFPNFQSELEAAFQNAVNSNLWTGHYAMTNSEEYFAEIVQCWFDSNARDASLEGVLGRLERRSQLKSYDSIAYDLLKKYFPIDQNKCSCH